MKSHFRQSMAWLHTWASLLIGWLLFFIFVTGTASFFMYDLTRWMEPERPLETGIRQAPQARQAEWMLDFLGVQAPGAREWEIKLPHAANHPANGASRTHLLAVSFPGGRTWWFDPLTGQLKQPPAVRATEGGEAFIRLHHQFHYMDKMTGIYLAGLCAFLALAAVVSGVIVHKKIFQDFFTFRPGKGQRSWLDAHNVSSVVALPFFVMILYTGLVYYSDNYLATPEKVINQFRQEAPARPEHLPIGERPAVPMNDVIAKAEQVFGNGQVGQLMVKRLQGLGLVVDAMRPHGAELTRSDTDATVVRFDAFSGERLPVMGGHGQGTVWFRTLVSLHEAWYATYPLRWLHFLSGLLGCVMVATGLVLWVVKRREKHARRGDAPWGVRLVACLNVAVIAGLPIAVAAFFWANRLLPVDIAERPAWELDVMFIAWGWLFCYAAFRPEKRAWVEIFGLAAAAFGLLPLLNALTTDRHLGVTVLAGDWPLAGVDLTMLAFGVVFASLAWRLHQRWFGAKVPMTSRPLEAGA